MTTEKAIKMIDEYLLEPNSIHKDWVECLRLCRQALVEKGHQKAEIERLTNKLEEREEMMANLGVELTIM